MGIGLFTRRRKGVSLTPPPPLAELEHLTLHVLVDSGPSAGELLAIRVNAADDVHSLRTAIAAQIGITSMSLFKVDIPWQAHYEAAAYSAQHGTDASVLSAFNAYNLDDPTQLGPSGGLPGMYAAGNGSLRSRRTMRALPTATPALRTWFPNHSDVAGAGIDIVARTASVSSLAWTRPDAAPITLSCRFALPAPKASSSRHSRHASTSYLQPREAQRVLVDIAPDATVAELKVALLLAAGRSAPAGRLCSLVLWRVDMLEADLAAIDARSGLTGGRAPWPCASVPAHLVDNARVSDYFARPGLSPDVVNLSAWIDPIHADALAPRFSIPRRFVYPPSSPFPGSDAEASSSRRSPSPPARQLQGPLPLPGEAPGVYVSCGTEAYVAPECPILIASERERCPTPPMRQGLDLDSRPATLRCCASHDSPGYSSFGGGGLVGLGISMIPEAPVSDASCSDDDGVPSWPPTPDVNAANGHPLHMTSLGVAMGGLGLGLGGVNSGRNEEWRPEWDDAPSPEEWHTPKHRPRSEVPIMGRPSYML